MTLEERQREAAREEVRKDLKASLNYHLALVQEYGRDHVGVCPPGDVPTAGQRADAYQEALDVLGAAKAVHDS